MGVGAERHCPPVVFSVLPSHITNTVPGKVQSLAARPLTLGRHVGGLSCPCSGYLKTGLAQCGVAPCHPELRALMGPNFDTTRHQRPVPCRSCKVRGNLLPSLSFPGSEPTAVQGAKPAQPMESRQRCEATSIFPTLFSFCPRVAIHVPPLRSLRLQLPRARSEVTWERDAFAKARTLWRLIMEARDMYAFTRYAILGQFCHCRARAVKEASGHPMWTARHG